MPSGVSTEREALFKRYQPLPDRAERNRRRLWAYMLLYVTLSSALVATAVIVGLLLALVLLTKGAGAGLVVLLARSGSTLAVVAVVTWAACFPAFASWYIRIARRPLLSNLLAALSATLVQPGELLQARSALREAIIAVGTTTPHLALIRDDSVNAFVIARGTDQAWIGVTSGLLERLNHDELRAVFAHLVARVRDGSALTNTVIASLFRAASQADRNGAARTQSDDWPGASILEDLAFPLVFTYSVVRTCVRISSVVILLGYRRAHAVTAESADSEGMLLTRDPEGMLGALEKVLPADNHPGAARRARLRDDALGALFFAWPGVKPTDTRELVRIRRMREVLGAAGA